MDWSDLGKPLPIDRIDFRVQHISPKGWANVLAYKDARVDMDRLDSVVGRGKWQRRHTMIGDALYCSVGLYNADIGDWIWVQDVGTESNTEAIKGRASDAFKRACFNLGIGRELYDFPLILVQLNENDFETFRHQGKTKAKATYNLRIQDWRWYMERDDSGVTFLACKDGNMKVRYQWGERGQGEAV